MLKNGKIKIIIVENDEDERMFMKDGFEESQCFEIVAFAGNGNELMTLLQEDTVPDMILSDLNMPGKNGYDVLKELRADSRFFASPLS